MSTNTARKAAPRPAKPVERYWRGKLPKGITKDASDSDEEDQREEEQAGDSEQEETLDEITSIVPAIAERKAAAPITVTLKSTTFEADAKFDAVVTEEAPDEQSEEQPEQDQESESGSESEEESEEEESRKPQFRPVFIPARKRATVAERETEVSQTERLLKEQEAARKQASHDLVGDSIRRELEAKEVEKPEIDVDDTDGLDPEAEFEAWRLRELSRIKRDKEDELRMELEREEVERRRAMPAEQRDKEDMERAKKLREEKPKGQQKFLQKYWHKGAFHQDADVLQRHDFTESTESTVDMTLLPKVMQKRNFGKRSQTKYTHLVDQDTTDRGYFVKDGASKGKHGQPGEGLVCYICGGPHMRRDCPQFTPAMAASSSLRSRDHDELSRGGGEREDGAARRPPSPGRNQDQGWRRRREESPTQREEKRARIG